MFFRISEPPSDIKSRLLTEDEGCGIPKTNVSDFKIIGGSTVPQGYYNKLSFKVQIFTRHVCDTSDCELLCGAGSSQLILKNISKLVIYLSFQSVQCFFHFEQFKW